MYYTPAATGPMEDDLQGLEDDPLLDIFSLEDFDAYLPSKWMSNMFTLERRRVKNKLELLGRELGRVLEEAGLSLVMHASEEFPSFWNKKKVDSQWLFFSRDEAAREEVAHLVDKARTLKDSLEDPTPRYRHVFLGVSVNEQGLEIGLRLHHDAWVDRNNFLRLSSTDESRKQFEFLVRSLPDHFTIGTGDSNSSSLKDVEPGRLEELATAFDKERSWLFLGARLPRDQVLVLEGDIGDAAKDVFRYLIPIYQFIAWSPSNDAISIESAVKERNETLRQSREELDRERSEREAMLKEKEARGLALKEEIAERIRETDAWRSREIAARRQAAIKAKNEAAEEDARARAEAMAAKWGLAGKGDDKAPKEPRRSDSSSEVAPRQREQEARSDERETKSLKSSYRDSGAKDAPHRVDASDELRVGSHVEVVRGFLKGRWGIVQDIDDKGDLRVSFGALSSRLEVGDVVTVDPIRANAERSRRNAASAGRRPQRQNSKRDRETLKED